MSTISRMFKRTDRGHIAGRLRRATIEALESRTLLSTVIVTNNADSGPGSLRDAIANASSGDTIVFADSVKNETITLTSGELAVNKSLDIEGPGSNHLTISGNNSSRVFDVSGSGNVTIAGLTITAGKATVGGAILENTTGSVSVNNCAVINNEALDDGSGAGDGGAIQASQGALNIANSTFTGNKAVGTSANASLFGFVGGAGGAVSIALGDTAPVTIDDSTFTGNQALGAAVFSLAGAGLGGAIGDASSKASCTLTIAGCQFNGNTAITTPGGAAAGGAMWVFSAGPVAISGSTFSDNRALGGNSGGGNANGGVMFVGSPVPTTTTVTACSFTANAAIGAPGADGVNTFGSGAGGAIVTSSFGLDTLIVRDSTMVGNLAMGAALAPDAAPPVNPSTASSLSSAGGGIAAFGALVVTNSVISSNEVIGGTGSANYPGIVGAGGGILVFGADATVSGCKIDQNVAMGGAGGAGTAGGAGVSGGIDLEGGAAITVTNSAIDHNLALGGAGGPGASGGEGVGGAIDVGTNVVYGFSSDNCSLTLNNCTLDHDQALGGAGGSGSIGGNATGGGLSVLAGSSATVNNTPISHNSAVGGDAATGASVSAGGSALGGGVYVGTVATVTIATGVITDNRAVGGQGHHAPAGQGIGGGVYNLGSFSRDALTMILGNHASTSNDDIFP